MSLPWLGALSQGRVGWLQVNPPGLEQTIDRYLAEGNKFLKSGAVAWLAEDGGLISNLKAWENVILMPGLKEATPLSHEARLQTLCQLLPSPTRDWPELLELPVARLDATERRVVGALRCLISAPELWIVDARIFKDVVFVRFWRSLVQFTAQTKVLAIGIERPAELDMNDLEQPSEGQS